MPQTSFVFFVLLVSGLLSACVSTPPNLPEAAFKPLFDGKTLNGWKQVSKQGGDYFVENGAIVCPKGGRNDLFTEKEYRDFVLRLEFKLTKNANNGVAFRAPLERGQIAYIGNEIQVIDDGHPGLKPGQNCGSLYMILPARPGALKPVGEWNNCEITAQGRRIRVALNGQTVTEGNLHDVTDPEILQRHPGMLRDRGHIGFLGHDDRVEFRRIRLHELPHYIEKDNHPPAGFTALFNGRDLTGWRGLVGGDPVKRAQMPLDEWARAQIKADDLMHQNWLVEKGTVTYTGKKWDNLCTEKQFGDFELLVDWKMGEPKADSGLYLRGYPQVQIWEPNSGRYDPAHPGSGGLFNNEKSPGYPARLADHYPGEWNRFRILMVGQKVHVFLNNELVVDNATMENFWERGKPLSAFGPVELQAHTSRVTFKNIFIREILPH